MLCLNYNQKTMVANLKNTIPVILFVCPSKLLRKHCFQFLLGLVMVPRENKHNAYGKFLEAQNKSFMVFLILSIYFDQSQEVQTAK